MKDTTDQPSPAKPRRHRLGNGFRALRKPQGTHSVNIWKQGSKRKAKVVLPKELQE